MMKREEKKEYFIYVGKRKTPFRLSEPEVRLKDNLKRIFRLKRS
jgi:hypothetical protein